MFFLQEYDITSSLTCYDVIIFDKGCQYMSDDGIDYIKGNIKRIKERIDYWKENDRYLIKLMEKGLNDV